MTLHHNLKPMTNTELTLDQLTAISGGVKQREDGRGCTDFFDWIKRPWCFPTDNDKMFGIVGTADPGGEGT